MVDTTANNSNISTTRAAYNNGNNVSVDEGTHVNVISISVPIAVVFLIGIVAAVFVLRRKSLHCLNSACQANKDTKRSNQNKPQVVGVENEAYTDQEKHESRRVEDTNYYGEAYEGEENMKGRPFSNNSVDLKLTNIVEDEYGYGVFKAKKNDSYKDEKIYQNIREQPKEAKHIITDVVYSNTKNGLPHLNVKHVSTLSSESYRQESSSVKKLENSEDAEDNLYDHAIAGGHKWENLERCTQFNTYGSRKEKNSTVSKILYENTFLKRADDNRSDNIISAGTSPVSKSFDNCCLKTADDNRRDDNKNELYTPISKTPYENTCVIHTDDNTRDDSKSEGKSPVSQNVYENTSFEISDDNLLRALDLQNNCNKTHLETKDECNIPFYLDLENSTVTIPHYRNFTLQEKAQPIDYDYASVDNGKPETHESQSENPDRHYFILEKENVVQEKNTEQEVTCEHEYFILEKTTDQSITTAHP